MAREKRLATLKDGPRDGSEVSAVRDNGCSRQECKQAVEARCRRELEPAFFRALLPAGVNDVSIPLPDLGYHFPGQAQVDPEGPASMVIATSVDTKSNPAVRAV